MDASDGAPLPGTAPLLGEHDFSAGMRTAFRKFLQRQLDQSVAARPARWQRNVASRAAYEESVEPNRARLREMLGIVEPRTAFAAPELVATVEQPALLATTATHTVTAIRWPIFDGVWGEGLLLDPRTPPRARLVALPEADQTPEMIAGLAPGADPRSQYAARLAAAGCQVIVPVFVNRSAEFSGKAGVAMTNMSHREWIHRQAFEMGRHVIGYEV